VTPTTGSPTRAAIDDHRIRVTWKRGGCLAGPLRSPAVAGLSVPVQPGRTGVEVGETVPPSRCRRRLRPSRALRGGAALFAGAVGRGTGSLRCRRGPALECDLPRLLVRRGCDYVNSARGDGAARVGRSDEQSRAVQASRAGVLAAIAVVRFWGVSSLELPIVAADLIGDDHEHDHSRDVDRHPPRHCGRARAERGICTLGGAGQVRLPRRLAALPLPHHAACSDGQRR